MPVQSPQSFVADFTIRQNCEYLESDDECVLFFENGAQIQFRSRNGEAVATNEVEPPFEAEDGLRRQLAFYQLKYRREYEAWRHAREQLSQAIAYFSSGMEVPAPQNAVVDSLEAGKVRCEALAAKIAEINESILKLPRLVELERRRALHEANRKAEVARVEGLQKRLSELSLPKPESLIHPVVSQ